MTKFIGHKKTFCRQSFATSYGGDPWSGRIFIQLSGMKMGEL